MAICLGEASLDKVIAEKISHSLTERVAHLLCERKFSTSQLDNWNKAKELVGCYLDSQLCVERSPELVEVGMRANLREIMQQRSYQKEGEALDYLANMIIDNYFSKRDNK